MDLQVDLEAQLLREEKQLGLKVNLQVKSDALE